MSGTSIFSINEIVQVNQGVKALLSGSSKHKEVLKKELSKLETMFAEENRKMNSLGKSHKSVRNQRRSWGIILKESLYIKIRKLGHKELRLIN